MGHDLDLNFFKSIYYSEGDTPTQEISSQSDILFRRYKRFRFPRSHVKVMTLTLFFLINLLLLRRSAYTGNFKSMQHFVPKIQTILIFKVTRQGHDLDLNFLNQSIAFNEIRLPMQEISSQSDISLHQPISPHFRSPRSLSRS